MVSSTAAKYAGALADVAEELKRTDRVRKELGEFSGIFRDSVELREFLAAPSYPLTVKQQVIRDVARKGGFCDTSVNFLLLLMERSRIGRLDEILDAFHRELDRRSGVVRAEVVSAHPLDPPARSRMEQALSRLTGSKVRAGYQLDDTLIGGVRVQIGSVVYDGTLKAQLDQIQRELSQ